MRRLAIALAMIAGIVCAQDVDLGNVTWTEHSTGEWFADNVTWTEHSAGEWFAVFGGATPAVPLVLQWEMNTTNNPTLDSSTFNNLGYLGAGAAAPTHTSNVLGLAYYDFDGSSDYITNATVASQLDATTGCMSAWVKLDDALGQETFLMVGDTSSALFTILLDISGNSVRLVAVSGASTRFSYSGTLGSRSAYMVDRWHYIAGVQNGTGTPEVWIDDQKFTTVAISNEPTYWWGDYPTISHVAAGLLVRSSSVAPLNGSLDDAQFRNGGSWTGANITNAIWQTATQYVRSAVHSPLVSPNLHSEYSNGVVSVSFQSDEEWQNYAPDRDIWLDRANATWLATNGNGVGSFNGSSARVNAFSGTALGATTSLTVSAWIAPDSLTANQVICAQWEAAVGKEFLMSLRSNGDIRFRVTGDNITAYGVDVASKISTGDWVYLTGVYDGGAESIRLYTNGVLAGTNNAPATIYDASTVQFSIGVEGDLATQWYSGAMDDVNVYLEAFSSNQVLSSYQVSTNQYTYSPHP